MSSWLYPAMMIGGSLLSALGSWKQAQIMTGPATAALQGQQSILAQQSVLADLQAQQAITAARFRAEAAQYNAALSKATGEAALAEAAFNASVLEQDALATHRAYAYEAYKLRQVGDKLLATQVTRYIKGGVQPMTGSAKEVYDESLKVLDLEEAALWYESAVKEARLVNQAAITRWQGNVLALRAEAQAAADTRLASAYITEGQYQAKLAEAQKSLYRLQRDVVGAQISALGTQANARLFGAGSNLLMGIGNAMMNMPSSGGTSGGWLTTRGGQGGGYGL